MSEEKNLLDWNSWNQAQETGLFLPTISIPEVELSENTNQDHNYTAKKGPDHDNGNLAKRFEPPELEKNVPEIDSELQKSESDLAIIPSVLFPEVEVQSEGE